MLGEAEWGHLCLDRLKIVVLYAATTGSDEGVRGDQPYRVGVELTPKCSVEMPARKCQVVKSNTVNLYEIRVRDTQTLHILERRSSKFYTHHQ